MSGQTYTPRYSTNRASLPRDPTSSRTMTLTDKARRLGTVFDGLAPLEPHDRVLELAKQSDALQGAGLPGDLHERLDLSDEGLAKARTAVSTGSRPEFGGMPVLRPECLTLSPASVDIVKRTIIGEARGESPAGRQAVANAIMNRLHAGRGIENIRNSRQFNAWRDSKALMGVREDSADYRNAKAAYLAACTQPDNASGAQDFWQPGGENFVPSWAVGKPTVTVGTQRFIPANKPAPRARGQGF